jgi:hypothetical protein
MGHEVYANNMAIVSKSADGKAICAFPDVCLSPPTPPAGPVPIPYPNTAMASDTAEGSNTVKLNGQEVVLKNKSYFSKSTGDEAATKTLGMGVVTHTIQGKMYFNSWSMDVKIEGENVCRNLDMTTHNHMSEPPNTPPWMYVDSIATPGGLDPCKPDRDKAGDACKDYKPSGPKDPCQSSKPSRRKASPEAHALADQIAADKCLSARRCILQPYKPSAEDAKKGHSCCPSQTPHHLIEASAVHQKGRKGTTLAGVDPTYREGEALSVCAEGPTQFTGTHGMMHTFQSAGAAGAPTQNLALQGGGSVSAPATTYGDAKKNALASFQKTFPESKCSSACIEHQLDYYHKRQGMDNNTKIKAVQTGDFDPADVTAAEQKAKDRSAAIQAASCSTTGAP